LAAFGSQRVGTWEEAGIGHVLTLKTLALARQAGKGPIQIDDVGYKQTFCLTRSNGLGRQGKKNGWAEKY